MTVALSAPPPLRDGEVTLVAVDARVRALLVAASNDAEITRWTQVPQGMSLLDAGLVTAGWASSHSAIRMQVCVPDESPAGMVTVWINDTGAAEVGYWLLSTARGRGVGRRAVRLLCDWAFAACDVDVMQLSTLDGNVASERLAAACGFACVGTVVRDIKGEPLTLLLWELRRPQAAGSAAQRAVSGT